jgi:hypothetical protein
MSLLVVVVRTSDLRRGACAAHPKAAEAPWTRLLGMSPIGGSARAGANRVLRGKSGP